MHRWSELFIPTLREAPADAEVASHKFLVRAGYIRQLAAGIYSYLFLGNRSFNKIMRIVREEMDRIGQEFYLPALHPREIWEASGRWALMGDNLFRLKDRKGADLALGMTEEEVMTSIALKELRSYKQLPQIWYQIAPKFRDEPRPKSGLLRVRQFMMKDAYSFDIDAAGLDVSYKKHYETYCRIFDRCGLKYMVVEADSGAMGGKESHEFMVRTPAGEDQIVSCDHCNYAANMEKAASRLEAAADLVAEGDGKPLEVHTPGQKTIADVAKFLGVSPKNKIKTLALMAEEKEGSGKTKTRGIVVLMRGDHQLNEAKLNGALGVATRPMAESEIKGLFKSPAGYLGPMGIEWANDLKKDAGKPGASGRPGAGGTLEPNRGREQRGLSLEESDAREGLSSYRVCGFARGNGGRGLPELREATADRYGGRDRPHLQTGVPVFGVDGRAGAGQGRQRGYANHGKLWHWD